MNISERNQTKIADTVSELRDLYRASEARAARLRLLMEAGQDLASIKHDNLFEALSINAQRAARFVGYRDGVVSFDIEKDGVPLIAPGPQNRRVGTLRLIGEANTSQVRDEEDQEALEMLARLIAAAMDRFEQETERNQLLAALQKREKHLEHLVGQLFSAQEDERRYVSRELHDGVAQTATALFRRLDARCPTNADVTSDDAQLADVAKGLVRELRSVIAGLRPTALDDLGLIPAIESLADGLRALDYDISFDHNGDRGWPDILTTAYFRIAQEALANIRKHAGPPCRVEITLTGDQDTNCWQLRIRDFGNGFRKPLPIASPEGQNVGVEMMRERMMAVGGSLEVAAEETGVSVSAQTVLYHDH
jgi:signal transduction histidine kinase